MPTKNFTKYYSPSDFGQKEVELMNTFNLQVDDARTYFKNFIKPRLDRSYKLYVGYTGDRQREIQSWQANVFTPYIQAVVETLLPRIIDARPEFTCQGRGEDDQIKAEKQQFLQDYFWEISGMDAVSEDFVRSAVIFGTAFLQPSWKKEVRELRFLETKDILKKPKYKKEKRVFYDAPFCERVDNYSLWYDWHNTARKNKHFWFKRLVLTGAAIKRKYPNADPKRLALALAQPGGDLTDYADIRYRTKNANERIVKSAINASAATSAAVDKFNNQNDPSLKMYEVFEWWRPFEDSYAVMVNDVPILKDGHVPIPFDFKEAPFIDLAYMRLPDEFEGIGIPLILENPQIMLNLIKNQRLDAATLSIHKMWVVNPMANINKEELVTRPFGIIYSMDPNGVREIQFSDIKSSAYREEEMLKGDMRYASGVDDSSMGVGGTAGSATEVRHLRESTLERVRLFVNHLGDSYAELMRCWMSMQRQFFTKNMQIRILGEDGKDAYPVIEADDLKGEFDYKATVLPSLAGQNELEKKQNMDLFQLLVNMPFVDPRKLTAKTLRPFSYNLESVEKEEAEEAPLAEDPMAQAGGEMLPGGAPPGAEQLGLMPEGGGLPLPHQQLSPQALSSALAMIQGSAGNEALPSIDMGGGFGEAARPINLLQSGSPPTVKGIPPSRVNPSEGRVVGSKTTNPRGLNRTGKVNTDFKKSGSSDMLARLMAQASNTQR